ncbi:oligosaccharide flippase family protein [Leptospira sp. GIMC2001]|uniref:oligosaccharide flippase family protein n=1 Tax=Leptospira sp. GIMC2001 TaxID=1513297 RepID=UPI0023498448|nr:oligosaccharide flippase family protein [Leptospira sp. GIMC2001]WCL48781.1 oligosaccharide flippase family protein [Leptospira sp. GIMC2001]
MRRIKQRIGEFRSEIARAGVFKNSIYVTISKVFSSLTNLIFMVYSVNLLTKPENGQFQYYLGAFPVILAIAEFGLPSALVKYMAPVTDQPKRIGSLLLASLLLKIYALLVLLAIGLITLAFLNENSLIVILLILGGFLASFASYFESILVSFRNYLALSIWNPLPNLVRLGILVLLVSTGDSDIGYIDIMAVYCLGPIFVIGAFFFIAWKENLVWFSEWKLIRQDQKHLAIFNSWALLASIFAIVSDRLEIFFLKMYHGPEAVAEYGTTLQLFSGFVIILSVLNSLVYPKLSRLVDSPEFRSFLVKSMLGGALMAILLFPGFFLGGLIMELLFRGNYSNSVPVFQMLYPNFLLQLVFAPLGMALYALGFPKMLAGLALLRLIFGLVLDNLLIPDFGTTGAALSLLLGQIVSWLLLVGYFLALFRNREQGN